MRCMNAVSFERGQAALFMTAGLKLLVRGCRAGLSAAHLRCPEHAQAALSLVVERERRNSVRSNRKRADRDDVATAVALGAVTQGLVDRVLFVGRLERQSGTPRGADRNRTPSI
jgi:hypothetical protein